MSTEIDPSSCLRLPAKGVATDILDNEVVIVNLTTGHYFSTDGVGCEVWQLLAAGTPVGEVVSTLRDRYTGGGEEAIEPYVHDIVRRALDMGLMVIDDGSDPSTTAAPAPSDILEPAAEGQPFVPAVFLGFDDLESLLMLDPVHEVDDKGWPHAATGV